MLDIQRRETNDKIEILLDNIIQLNNLVNGPRHNARIDPTTAQNKEREEWAKCKGIRANKDTMEQRQKHSRNNI